MILHGVRRESQPREGRLFDLEQNKDDELLFSEGTNGKHTTSLDGADYYIPLKIIKVSTPYLSSKKEIAK